MLQKWAADEQLKQRILTYGREVNELYGLSGSVPAVVWIDAGGLVVETAWGKLGPARLERSTKRVLARS
jgi:hypothetical protein